MSERLIIRISDASQPIFWAQVRVSDNQVTATGECDHLSALTEQAQTRRVVILVDSTWVTLRSVTLPPGSRRQRDKVVPYLLEEALADDVDRVHVSILSVAGSLAHVAVVAHDKMQAWQQALTDADIHARQWLPDVLCLPWQTNHLTVAPLGEQWLCRHHDSQGVVGSRDWLRFWAHAWRAQQHKALEQDPVDADNEDKAPSLTLHGYCPSHLDLDWPVSGLDEAEAKWHPCDTVIGLLATQSHTLSANLLTGPYRPQSQTKQTLKPLLPAACLVLAISALLGVEQWLTIRDTQQQAQALRAQSESVFRQTLPQYQRIPTQSYMVRQMDAEIARLEGQQHNAALLPWLAKLAPMLEKTPGIHLQALRYQAAREVLVIRASGSDFAQFERLRGLLSEHYTTELGQLNRNGDSVSGEFTLRSES
ncbi:type II secretion system protein GspL [Salinivibrio sp. PR5]|uniref:type II secretion system protein GspL n=1 Tax=Salinivibrio sp. PR5 TaxID=1909484 RepID=UPI0009C81A56|nr:type II secretion system protein GspL [Salinivibrio sp. PR5]OOF09870.1 type II secretion system protein GspL [Salinivibrio sp. PR5]